VKGSLRRGSGYVIHKHKPQSMRSYTKGTEDMQQFVRQGRLRALKEDFFA
jgi:hypothetical protein